MKIVDSRRKKDPAKRWKLYFAPDLPLVEDSVKLLTPREIESRESEIAALAASIEETGLQNPVAATRSGLRLSVHPGKARVEAVRRLGWTCIPAIVIDYTSQPPAENWTPLEVEELAYYMDDTYTASVSWRYCSIFRDPKA